MICSLDDILSMNHVLFLERRVAPCIEYYCQVDVARMRNKMIILIHSSRSQYYK